MLHVKMCNTLKYAINRLDSFVLDIKALLLRLSQAVTNIRSNTPCDPFHEITSWTKRNTIGTKHHHATTRYIAAHALLGQGEIGWGVPVIIGTSTIGTTT
jgi:hypothetical protein